MMDNSSSDMYNYLIENYDSVTIENGYYHIENTSGYRCEAYIPVSYDRGDIINVYTFTPGTNERDGGKVAVRGLVERENTPECAIFICYDYRRETTENNIIQHAAEFANNNGMTIANLGAESFSGGGGNSLMYVAQFASNPANANTDVVAVMSESFSSVNFQGGPSKTSWNYSIGDDTYNALIENGVKVYGVSNPHNLQFGSGGRDDYLSIARKGVDMTFIYTDEYDHLGTLEASVANGMTFYLMGISDDLGNYAPHNQSGANYQPYVYVDGHFVAQGTMADYHGVDNSIFITDEMLNIEEYQKIYDYGKNKGSMTLTKIDAPEKYAHLKNLEHLSINIGSNIDPAISSSLNYIENSVNAIRDQIKTSGFMQGYSKPTFSSSTGIPGCLSGYIDAYYNIMYDLMDRVEEQTEAIISYGQSYVEMDTDLATKAEELVAGTATGSIEESPSRFLNDNPSPAPSVQEIPEEPVVSPENPTNNPTGTTPGSGGGPTNPTNPSNPGTPTTPETPTGGETTTEPHPEGANLIEMERSDGSKVVAVMDGDKVKELKYVYEYDTTDEAKNNLKAISNKYKEVNHIEEVKLNENKVEVIFKEEAYKDMDLEAIIEKYFVDEE
ncbi:MAG: hypothetical protein IKR57_06765 [Bacilli bacterium]|nr:hypothetical protein [Bacilli bacterium]